MFRWLCFIINLYITITIHNSAMSNALLIPLQMLRYFKVEEDNYKADKKHGMITLINQKLKVFKVFKRHIKPEILKY